MSCLLERPPNSCLFRPLELTSRVTPTPSIARCSARSGTCWLRAASVVSSRDSRLLRCATRHTRVSMSCSTRRARSLQVSDSARATATEGGACIRKGASTQRAGTLVQRDGATCTTGGGAYMTKRGAYTPERDAWKEQAWTVANSQDVPSPCDQISKYPTRRCIRALVSDMMWEGSCYRTYSLIPSRQRLGARHSAHVTGRLCQGMCPPCSCAQDTADIRLACRWRRKRTLQLCALCDTSML